MQNLDSIERATQECAAQGMRVLNAFLLADSEQAHVARLLELMAPPEGATVLDAGCGIGEVAKLMREARPDLSFRLLNISEGQLAQCPAGPGFERVLGDYNAIPLPDASVDCVMFNFSLCHAPDWLTALREAARVVRDDGILFIFDMVRSKDGSNALMAELLQAGAYRGWQVVDVASRAGFEVAEALGHVPAVYRLREAFGAQPVYDTVFDGVVPFTARLHRRVVADPVASAFARHERIAFQFSGGRDSTAALYVLRPYWKYMDLYHLDTQDQFPETREVFQQVAAEFTAATGRPPRVIVGDVHAVRAEHGLASDLVPVDTTAIGRMVSGRATKIISRYECCARSLMQPMHQRMLADGITLIVRGQRDDEYDAPPKRSGDVEGGVEVLYPIQSWSAGQVQEYLQVNSLPIAAFYLRGMKRAPECMGCTAWWDEGRAGYLREHHPQAFATYAGRMKTIRIEIDRQYALLDDAPLTRSGT